MNDRTKENIGMFGALIGGLLIIASVIWIVLYMTYQMFGSYDFMLIGFAIGCCIAIPITCVFIYFQEKGFKKHKNPGVVI